MFRTAFENLRQRAPLIHNITNYVTVNDCANMVLACGASPIMADDLGEVEEITALCAGLNINIGTLNSRTIDSMLLAGRTANRLGHPVVLDPVGAGASRLRTGTALRTWQTGSRKKIWTLQFGLPKGLPPAPGQWSPSPVPSTSWQTGTPPTASATAMP